MDYKKLYEDFIESRKTRILEDNTYTETHHIVPKCLGGTNEFSNLVRLTYREHYIAHLILTRIYKTHSGIQYGFLCMLRKHPTGERILTSKMYETIKKNFSKFKKWHIIQNNPGKTENSRNAARKRMTERNPMKLDPSKNRTAQPIKIYFEDGTVEEYSYAKEFCIKNNVSYSTMKHWLKNPESSSKKHKILKIERIAK